MQALDYARSADAAGTKKAAFNCAGRIPEHLGTAHVKTAFDSRSATTRSIVVNIPANVNTKSQNPQNRLKQPDYIIPALIRALEADGSGHRHAPVSRKRFQHNHLSGPKSRKHARLTDDPGLAPADPADRLSTHTVARADFVGWPTTSPDLAHLVPVQGRVTLARCFRQAKPCHHVQIAVPGVFSGQ